MVFLIPVTRHQEHLIENLSQLFLFCMLAALVAYGTGCLAGRLAGCLAFAASTFFNCILKILRMQWLGRRGLSAGRSAARKTSGLRAHGLRLSLNLTLGLSASRSTARKT